MARYNHQLGLGFSLISNDPEGEDITPAMIRAAVLARMASLTDDELVEAVGGPEDTYEENA